MTRLKNGFEGQTANADVTQANSATSGTGLTSAPTKNGGTVKYTAAAAASGSLGLAITGVSGSSAFVEWAVYNDVRVSQAVAYDFTTAPDADYPFFALRTEAGGTVNLIHKTSGKLVMVDGAGATQYTSPGVLTGKKRCEVQVLSDASAGSLSLQTFPIGSSTADNSSGTLTGLNTRGGAITRLRVGKNSTSTSTFTGLFDNFDGMDGVLQSMGPYSEATNPTASFTSSASNLNVTFDASGSAVTTSGATITSYAWDFGDSSTGTGVGPTHGYASAGTYTVALTVTDSNGKTASTSKSVTVTAAAAGGSTATVASVTTAGSYSANTGTLVNAVSDGNTATWATSPSGGGTARFKLGPLAAPSSGTDMTVTVEADFVDGTSGTISAKLYEGSTLRATATGQTMVAGVSSQAVASTVTITFPAASIVNVSSNGWASGLDVEITQAAS